MSSPASSSPGRMASGTLLRLAWRDLGRNRRRSLLSLLAVALGLTLLIVLNGLVAGVIRDMAENGIRYETGHLQLRMPDYDEESLSLRPSTLVDRLDERLAAARARPGVLDATPVLWVRGLVTGPEEAVDLVLTGIDPAGGFHEPIREGLVEGSFLDAADRDGILIGQRLARSLGLSVGQRVELAVIDGEGALDEGPFTVRGIFATGIPSYDERTAFLSLDKAQAFARSRGRASAIVLTLEDRDEADALAESLATPELAALTWYDLNESMLGYMNTATRIYWILDAIVMLVVAVVVANTLLMAVFERIREMGILAALGMRGGQILRLYLTEALLLGLLGCAAGLVLGTIGVVWMERVGVDMGEEAMAGAGDIALGAVMRADLVPSQMLLLAAWTLAIILLAAYYPARLASRLEPVDALRRN